MKTITEMQTQIKEMSAKLDEFARDLSEYNGAGKQETTIDFKQIKAIGNRNPIEGHILATADADVKKTYLTMLIATAYTAQDNQENAWLLIQRIASGANFPEKLIDLSVDAVNLTDAQIDKFTLMIVNAKLTNSFVLDTMLVYLSCEHVNEKMLEFLAALFELVKCGKKEIQEISELARIIATQNSAQYSDFLFKASNIYLPEHNFYVKPFHFGIQYVDSNYYHISGNGKSILTDKEIETIMTTNAQQVIIENVVINLNERLVFKRRDCIIFNNCKFIATNYYLWFISCNYVEFNHCSFSEMSNRVASLQTVTELRVIESQFIKCGFECNGESGGGVFELLDDIQTIELVGSIFNLCYVKANSYRSNYGVSGCIMHGNSKKIDVLKIHDCEFLGSECINNGNYTETLFFRIASTTTSIENNKITGKVQRLIN